MYSLGMRKVSENTNSVCMRACGCADRLAITSSENTDYVYIYMFVDLLAHILTKHKYISRYITEKVTKTTSVN